MNTIATDKTERNKNQRTRDLTLKLRTSRTRRELKEEKRTYQENQESRITKITREDRPDTGKQRDQDTIDVKQC